MSRVKQRSPDCLACGKPVKASHYKYCDNRCQQEYQHRVYVERWLAGQETGRKRAFFVVSGHVRRWLAETCGERCVLCGWAECNPHSGKIPLEVDHVDGNAANCRPENLRLLCPNCHSLTPTYGQLNKGRGGHRPNRGRRRAAV